MDSKDELRWVRSQIEALMFSRSSGGAFSDSDRARYRDLCAREETLLLATVA